MTDGSTSQHRGAGRYEVRVSGHLASRWEAWFDGMTLTWHDDGTTAIHGMVTDQAALHGLLRKLNDLGVLLVSVTLTAPEAGDAPPRHRSALTDPHHAEGAAS